MRKLINKVFRLTALLIFVGLVIMGQIVANIVSLVQASVVDYRAIMLQTFFAFATVIIFTVLWYFVDMAES